MPEETLAWRAIKPGWNVVARDGSTVGTVGRVLADEGADIFHGITVRRGMRLGGENHEVLAAQIDMISEDTVHTTLEPQEVAEQPSTR